MTSINNKNKLLYNTEVLKNTGSGLKFSLFNYSWSKIFHF